MRIIGSEPDYTEPLWRYFKTERFLDLIRTGEVYFSSARQFGDRFEGAVAVLPPKYKPDPRYPEPELFEQAFEELRRLTKISCWHRASYESTAMWQLYANKGRGVAIETNLERVKTALKPFRLAPEYGEEELWAGNVNYVDLLEERLRVSMVDRFWYKHLAFRWENECRLAITVRMAEEFGVHVPEFGVKVRFDLSELIGRIHLGPFLPGDEIERIIEAAQERGLGDQVLVSSLLGTPRYT